MKTIYSILLILLITGCQKEFQQPALEQVNDADVLRPPEGYNQKQRPANFVVSAKGRPVSSISLHGGVVSISPITIRLYWEIVKTRQPYQVYANGNLIGTASIQEYTVTGWLQANTEYSFYIIGSNGVFSDTLIINTGGVPDVQKAVVYLDTDGEVVTNTQWNGYLQIISATPANMTDTEIQLAMQYLKTAFLEFGNVIVTNDRSVYDAASPFKRTMVIGTEFNEWYPGSAGGVAYLNTYGTKVPAWVFTKSLSYRGDYVGKVAAHEAGHTLGLYHQVNECGQSYGYQYPDGSAAYMGGAVYYTDFLVWKEPGMDSRCIMVNEKSHINTRTQ